VYAIGREGIAKLKLEDESTDLSPLLDTILRVVPPAQSDISLPLRAQPFNLAYDNYMGRLAIMRIYEGVIHSGDVVFAKNENGSYHTGRISKLFSFKGISRVEIQEAQAGDIVLMAGLTEIYIGETVSTTLDVEPLPAIKVDDPTIALNFLVNNSPFAGREGKYVTSRQLRERLERELEVNVGLKIDFSELESMRVYGRGELHIAILLENMRREGYEMQISQPQVIVKDIDGVKSEPFEEITIDVPAEYQGVVIEKLGSRGAIITNMKLHENTARITMEGPTRGMLGYRNQFIVDTKGLGIMASRVIGFKPWAGEIKKRQVGSMISMVTGKVAGYALWGFQERGILYITPATEVYEGQVIGNTSKGEEMAVNPTKGKNLTNVRSSGNDEAIVLVPAYTLTIERGMEVMADDEYLEITPKSVRLRKMGLTDIDRARIKREQSKDA